MKIFSSLIILALFGSTFIFGNPANDESSVDSKQEKTELSVPQESPEARPNSKKMKKKKLKLKSEPSNGNSSDNDAPPAPPVY